MLRSAVLALAAVAALSGCGGDERRLPASNGLPAQGDQVSGAPSGPAPCAPPPATADPLPAAYPPGLLPDGAVVTAVRQKGEIAVLEGYVAGETLETLLRRFESEIAEGGFRVESSDYEGFEGEWFFRSDVLAGFVRVTDGGCVPDSARYALNLQRTG